MAAPTKVMIVETDPELKNELIRILKASPHAMASEVTEPEGAMSLYLKTRPDVVITRLVFPPDGKKPRMGGTELMKLLKTVDNDVKIIVSYDINTTYLVMGAIRAGATARIKRPYKYQMVLKAIGDVANPDSAGATLVRLKKPLQVKYKVARKWIGGGQKPSSSPAIAFTQILLNTEEELAAGTGLELEIALPRLKEPLRGQGKVQKIKTVIPGHSYEIDCVLSGLSPEAKRKLDVFLVWGEFAGQG